MMSATRCGPAFVIAEACGCGNPRNSPRSWTRPASPPGGDHERGRRARPGPAQEGAW